MSSRIISYAQNKEDIILNALLKDRKKGFYIDVGANHPVTDSVTKLFYEKGWHGINIEPASNLYAALSADRSRDINLQLGISSKQGELSFREYELGDGLSTFSKDTQKQYEKDKSYQYFASKYVDRIVPVTTLSNVFVEHVKDKKVDFIKIDIEGYEYEAIEGNNWKKYRPTIVCVEANHMIKDWRSILLAANYIFALNDGLNDYFVAKEEQDLLKDYSYADAMFFPPFISWRELKKDLRWQRQVALLSWNVEKMSAANTQNSTALPTTLKSWLRYSLIHSAKALAHYLNLPEPIRKISLVSNTDHSEDGQGIIKSVKRQASISARPRVRAMVRHALQRVYRAAKWIRGRKI